MWLASLVAPQHMRFNSLIREQFQLPCIGRQSLYHWPSREVPILVSASVSLSVEDISDKQNHAAFLSYDWLISLSVMSSRFIYVVEYGRISSLLKATIPLWLCKMCFLLTPLLMDAQVVSASWLWCIMLQWTWACCYLLDTWFQFFWINA